MIYKAVCFDYGGVLKGHPSSKFGTMICTELDIDNETYLTAYFHHNKKLNRDEITWPELWKLVLDEIGQPEKINDVLRIQAEFYNDMPLNPPMVELVYKLRSKGFKTGLLSNNSASLEQELKQNGLYEKFDVVDISAITGLVKPEPEAFAHLAEGLEVQLSEIIFIDDSPKSLSTAGECGFKPILFESYDKLVKDLQDLNIL